MAESHNQQGNHRHLEIALLEEKSQKFKFERNALRELLDRSVKFISSFDIRNMILDMKELETAIYDEEKIINDFVIKIEELMNKESEQENQNFMIQQMREQLVDKEEKLRGLMSRKEKIIESLDEIYDNHRYNNPNSEEIQKLGKENMKVFLID